MRRWSTVQVDDVLAIPSSRRAPRLLGARAVRMLGGVGVAAVLVVGTSVRLWLIPRGNGSDFVVWDLASRATLRGSNIYAHHPAGYPGGPFSYLPLFLYIEVPLQWLAIHLGLPFRVLGKLPMLVADLAVAIAIARELRRRGRSERVQAVGAALWFLNPLLIYNSAHYGRFDSVCVALLLAAILVARRGGPHPAREERWSLVLLGAAIATKLFPAVLLPWFWTRGRRPVRSTAICAGVCALITLPYLLSSPAALYRDVVRYNAGKGPTNLTWQTALRGHLAPGSITRLDLAVTIASVAILLLLRRRDLWWYSSIAIGCFLVSSNVVIEQYFLWPLPFLIVLAVGAGSRSARFLIVWLSAWGMLINTDIHPFGRQGSGATEWLNVAIAIGIVVCVAALERGSRSTARPPQELPSESEPRWDDNTVRPADVHS